MKTLILFLSTAIFLPASLFGQVKSEPVRSLQEVVALRSDQLKQSEALKASLKLSIQGITLRQCLSVISKTAKCNLEVSDEMADRRLSLSTPVVPLAEMMIRIAEISKLSWISMPGTSQSKTYTLFQSSRQKSEELALILKSEQREKMAEEAKINAVMSAVQGAIDQSDRSTTSRFLSGLTQDQLKQAAALASEPEGVIHADDNLHYASRLFGVSRFQDLPSDSQNAVKSLLEGKVFDPQSNNKLTPDSLIGLVSADGELRVAVALPGGKDIWPSNESISRKGISGVDSDDDTDPEIWDDVKPDQLLNLTVMSGTLRRMKIAFPANINKTHLSELTQFLSVRTGVAIYSDDWINSAETKFTWLLTDQDNYTLEEALGQISKAFGHRIEYRNHMLYFTTVALGLDIRSEPPPKLMKRMRDLTASKLNATFEDYVNTGSLNRRQIDNISTKRFSGIEVHAFRHVIQMLHKPLQVCSLLTPAQFVSAQTIKGFSPVRMNKEQKSAYLKICSTGLPLLSSLVPKNSGFYIQRLPLKEGVETIRFITVSTENSSHSTVYELSIPANPKNSANPLP